MSPTSCDMCDAWRTEALRSREQLQHARLMADADLLAAFTAGFEASAEGFNGEYLGRQYRTPEAYQALMLRQFGAWRNV